MITWLDGYAEAAEGDLGTGPAGDQEVHTFIGDTFRHVGTFLYGRRMYETMILWETAHTEPDVPVATAVLLVWARTAGPPSLPGLRWCEPPPSGQVCTG